jgi:hypothetical protein
MKIKTILINDSNDFNSGTKYMRLTNLVPYLEEEEEEVIE